MGAGSDLHLYSGNLHGVSGPGHSHTPNLLAYLALDSSATAVIPIPEGWSVALLNIGGDLIASGERIPPDSLGVFSKHGAEIAITAVWGGEMILMAGEPNSEQVAVRNGFFMSNQDELDAADAAHRAGHMGRISS